MAMAAPDRHGPPLMAFGNQPGVAAPGKDGGNGEGNRCGRAMCYNPTATPATRWWCGFSLSPSTYTVFSRPPPTLTYTVFSRPPPTLRSLALHQQPVGGADSLRPGRTRAGRPSGATVDHHPASALGHERRPPAVGFALVPFAFRRWRSSGTIGYPLKANGTSSA